MHCRPSAGGSPWRRRPGRGTGSSASGGTWTPPLTSDDVVAASGGAPGHARGRAPNPSPSGWA